VAVERETIIERPVERETIVERPTETVVVDGGGGGGAALIAGILVALALAVLFFWIFSGGLERDASVTIEAPKVTQN
jgi:hypothetical protein